MSEYPRRHDNDEDVEREREESTDLGYRDTEEERAYEEAEPSSPPEGENAADGG
jgi:hypothetical protein